MTCRCENVEFGSYDNTVEMIPPFVLYDILGNKKDVWFVSVDTCIASDIGYLWRQGVVTENSCCGHGRVRASVVVHPDSIDKMHELGYGQIPDAEPECTFFLYSVQ
jgi:hypothetical protein